jgi:hypothetical protein
MVDYKEEAPGGKKSEHLGNHTYTTEAGHVIEIDNTPGDCRIHVYHKSGTFIEIKEDGAMITKVEGKTQEFNNNGRDQNINGNFNITIKGNVDMNVTGNFKQEVHGNYELITHGEYRIKSKSGHFHEVGGDQRVQVNGVTSHRTSGDRDETTGGVKIQSVLSDYFSAVGGEYQQNISTDASISCGGQMALTSGGQMGLGAGDTIGIATTAQFQTKAATGTFIRDDYYVEVKSKGSGGTIVAAEGYKVGIFSTGNDIRVGAGGKFLTETDGGTKLDTDSLIYPIGKFIPTYSG